MQDTQFQIVAIQIVVGNEEEAPRKMGSGNE